MSSPSPEKEVIQRIRRDRFLLDVDIPLDMVAGLTSIREDLDRALKLLSQDLYSTKTHFVLELVQNADDNSYAKGAYPSLHFHLTPSVLIVSNNETGFQEPNVEALCRTGRSSKAQKAGYIGEKGIGFKSVFTVSDAPEIHSNGYHFRFDRTASGTLLGYVVPHWYEPTQPLDASLTNIVIPAKEGAPFDANVLADLEARLLLFLGKLRRLSFATSDRRVELTRTDQGVITKLSTLIAENGQERVESEHFVRVEHNLAMADLVEGRRPNITHSQLVLAMPVAHDSKAKPDNASLAYAFLPIRSFGLKFAVQADFLLISSRGDIQVDLPWNIRLRDSIAAAFLSGLPAFKKRQGLAHTFLSFLPSDEDRVDAFFKPVVTQLRSLLGQTECILSESGQWRRPTEILLSVPKFRELFTSQDIRKLFGLDYVKSEVTASSDTLAKLGCQPVTYQHILSVFKEHAGWFNRKSREWKAKYYGFLANLSWDGLARSGLLKLPCVPLSTGGYIVPEQKSAFLPLSHDRTYGFEHELSIIDKKLYDKGVELSPGVADLFARLNTRPADSYQLITRHILPTHQDGSWSDSENAAIVGHLRYIKENIDGYLQGAAQAGQNEEDALELLSSTLRIGTKDQGDKWMFNQAEDLYLSKEYRPDFNIESLLGSAIPATSLVSPEYLKVYTENADASIETDLAGWRVFLLRLGVREAPRLIEYTDGDYGCSPELTALLQHQQSSVRKAVLECIDGHWHKYSNAISYNRREGRHYIPTATEFVIALRACIAPTRKATRAALSEAFLNTPELRELFGESAVYLDANLRESGFIRACKITDRADAQACLKRLRQLMASGTDTTPVLRRLYGQLHHLWEKEGAAIKAAFEREGLIRIRGERAAWLAPGETCWRSTSHLSDLVYAPLVGIYGDLEVFFGRLGVPKKLPLTKLVAALPRLTEFSSIDERVREALIVYRDCARELNLRPSHETLEPPRWLSLLLKQPAFLTVDGRVVANSTALYLDDSPEFGHLFHDQPGIDIFAVGGTDQPKISKLLELVQLQRLSEHIEIELFCEDVGELNQKFTSRLQSAFEPIARVVSHFDHDAFERAVESGAFNTLRHAEVREVEQLHLAVTLNEAKKGTSGEICLSEGRIIFRRGVKSLPDRISVEVCRLLHVGRHHSDAITRLLIAADPLEMDEYLQVKGIPALSPEDEDALLAVGSATDAVGSGEAPVSTDEVGASDTASRTESEASEVAVPTVQPPSIDSGHLPSAAPVNSPAPAPDARVAPANPTPTWPLSPNPLRPSGSYPSHGPINRTPGSHRERSSMSPAATSPGGARSGIGTSTTGGAANLPRVSTPNTPSLMATGGGAGAAPKPTPSETLSNGPGTENPKPAPIIYTRRGRLLSYAEAPADSSDRQDTDVEGSAARDAIATAAVQAFLTSKAAKWKHLTEMPPNNPGFDVSAVAHDGGNEFIEVKGQSGAWTEEGVALTPMELTHAHLARSRYWLCVVEFALDPARRVVHLINDPFSRVTQFRFDSGWKSQVLADDATKSAEPEVGIGS